MKKLVIHLFMLIAGVLATQSAFADYCLKVNIWKLPNLPEEMQRNILRTIENEKKQGFAHEDFSRKHGKELRLGADGPRPNIPCDDIVSGKYNDSKGINTGKWARDLNPTTVTVTYHTGIFKKETVTAVTESGIARFYFKEPYKLEVRFENQDQFLSPVQEYILLQISEWKGDDVVSVHGVKK
jgi:hypothetical protein